MTITSLPRERRPTFHFLNEVRALVPVFLDTEVDMTQVLEHRAAASDEGRRYSLVSYALHTAARVLANHPEANAAISGRLRPRIARYASASGKLALDRTLNGHRVVVTVVLPDLDQASLDEVQRQVDRYRDGDLAQMAEFAGIRALQRLPVPLGRALVHAGLRSLRKRPELMGTFAVSSLGHRPVDGFHSVGGTTITLGLGRILDRPVVRNGLVAVAPVMRLNLAFDHRVIDGAEAADVLADLADGLEHFRTGPAPAPSAALFAQADRSTEATQA
jgi:pyruvate/2-oxoglutarate dehydrogenase complex dihydrolipoamide acyltransferase (E2) component